MLGPELAMLRMPRPVCERLGRNSSLKGFPQYDSPPGRERSTAGSKNDWVLDDYSQQDTAHLQKSVLSPKGHWALLGWCLGQKHLGGQP